MKIRNKSPATMALIENLQGMGLKNPIWKAVARNLNRPERKGYEVNLFRIEKYAKPKGKIVVPGIVLGAGGIKKAVTVAALRFSGAAREKIEKAGGKCLTIEEMVKENPKGKGVRIIG
jgi:large subunit ribosomal protein L18e